MRTTEKLGQTANNGLFTSLARPPAPMTFAVRRCIYLDRVARFARVCLDVSVKHFDGFLFLHFFFFCFRGWCIPFHLL